uniref:Uncharacterized protein n=1 Tax=Trichogramma kaykai TaxID=54128 RepID=A0ABD2XD99_9HYME
MADVIASHGLHKRRLESDKRPGGPRAAYTAAQWYLGALFCMRLVESACEARARALTERSESLARARA